MTMTAPSPNVNARPRPNSQTAGSAGVQSGIACHNHTLGPTVKAAKASVIANHTTRARFRLMPGGGLLTASCATRQPPVTLSSDSALRGREVLGWCGQPYRYALDVRSLDGDDLDRTCPERTPSPRTHPKPPAPQQPTDEPPPHPSRKPLRRGTNHTSTRSRHRTHKNHDNPQSPQHAGKKPLATPPQEYSLYSNYYVA